MLINGRTINAHDVRRAVFNVVPEWKETKRVSCTVYQADKWRAEIRLMVGLLGPGDREMFDRTGTLDDVVDQIAEELGMNVLNYSRQHRDHRFRFVTLVAR